jgi:hypothetical protein
MACQGQVSALAVWCAWSSREQALSKDHSHYVVFLDMLGLTLEKPEADVNGHTRSSESCSDPEARVSSKIPYRKAQVVPMYRFSIFY